jgi:hypothetical protein
MYDYPARTKRNLAVTGKRRGTCSPRRRERWLLRGHGCGFAFLADEDHQDLGRHVALIEKLVLVIESLDVRLAGFVTMRLS